MKYMEAELLCMGWGVVTVGLPSADFCLLQILSLFSALKNTNLGLL
jgi:hypothetical protein